MNIKLQLRKKKLTRANLTSWYISLLPHCWINYVIVEPSLVWPNLAFNSTELALLLGFRRGVFPERLCLILFQVHPDPKPRQTNLTQSNSSAILCYHSVLLSYLLCRTNTRTKAMEEVPPVLYLSKAKMSRQKQKSKTQKKAQKIRFIKWVHIVCYGMISLLISQYLSIYPPNYLFIRLFEYITLH